MDRGQGFDCTIQSTSAPRLVLLRTPDKQITVGACPHARTPASVQTAPRGVGSPVRGTGAPARSRQLVGALLTFDPRWRVPLADPLSTPHPGPPLFNLHRADVLLLDPSHDHPAHRPLRRAYDHGVMGAGRGQSSAPIRLLRAGPARWQAGSANSCRAVKPYSENESNPHGSPESGSPPPTNKQTNKQSRFLTNQIPFQRIDYFPEFIILIQLRSFARVSRWQLSVPWYVDFPAPPPASLLSSSTRKSASCRHHPRTSHGSHWQCGLGRAL